MKHLIKIIATFFVLTFASVANAAITDGKFGTAQIFDVQWYWNAGTNQLVTSNYTYIYKSSGGISQFTSSDYAAIDAANQYFAFFDSTTDPGTYGLALYNSNGTLSQVIHDTGTFTALADGAIFYNGDGSWGTLITTAEGYYIGDSNNFDDVTLNPNSTHLANWEPDSTEPLAAGETAPTSPTPVYISSITTAQTTTKTTGLAYTTGNYANIVITGNDNDVDVSQLSNGNYVDLSITGDDNVVEVTQVSSTLARHFAEIDLIGSDNQFSLLQSDSAKTAFISADGDFNVIDIIQKDGGLHYLDLASLGDNAQITILQEGTGNHSATIDLENGGGNWVFELTQSGATDYLYSLPHNLTDNSVVSGVCYSGTCNISIVQQ